MSILVVSSMPTDVPPETPIYEPRGACLDMFCSRDDECVLSGPQGTGKSLACLFKLHCIAENYDNCRLLIIRKMRESLTESALVTYESKVLPPNSPIASNQKRDNRTSYVYPNGSEIIVSGLRRSNRDNTAKVFSTEYDIIYVQEATELTEEDWENLSGRLRNNKVPYQQLIGDTNPSAPTHWLKKRSLRRACCARGTCKATGIHRPETVCRMLESMHTDNPAYWDRERQEWTEQGKRYIARLDSYTGNRKERLRYGRWVQSEGVVYNGWRSNLHVIDEFQGITRHTIPKEWKRFLSVDFGYFPDPLAIGWWAVSPDNRLFLYRELVQNYLLVEDAARAIAEYNRQTGEPEFQAVICDHDREDRATLERHLQVSTTKAWKNIEMGIQFVAKRLEPDHKGIPKIMVFRDALLFRDQNMEDAKKPIGLIEEMDSYIWRQDSPTGPRTEPLDKFNHSCDCLRYICAYLEDGIQFVAPHKVELPKLRDWTKPDRKLPDIMKPGKSVPGFFGANPVKPGQNPWDLV